MGSKSSSSTNNHHGQAVKHEFKPTKAMQRKQAERMAYMERRREELENAQRETVKELREIQAKSERNRVKSFWHFLAYPAWLLKRFINHIKEPL